MSSDQFNILSTRPLSKQIIETAAIKNIVIDEVEFIKTEAIGDNKTVAAIKTFLHLNSTVVFTSMNAVEVVAAYIEDVVDWKIYCIGNTTKNLVQRYFGDVIKGTGNDAGDLANTIVANKETEVIFFCGNQRRDELPSILKTNNIALKELMVYNTIPLQQKLHNQYDGILFYSPSAVESFFSNNNINTNTILFAIGETTALAIKQYSSNQIIKSDEVGKDKLVEKAMSFYDK